MIVGGEDHTPKIVPRDELGLVNLAGRFVADMLNPICSNRYRGFPREFKNGPLQEHQDEICDRPHKACRLRRLSLVLINKVGQTELKLLKFGFVRVTQQVERFLAVVQVIWNGLVVRFIMGLLWNGTLDFLVRRRLGFYGIFTKLLSLKHQFSRPRQGLCLAGLILACFVD